VNIKANVAEWWSVSESTDLNEKWLKAALNTTLPQHLDTYSSIIESSFDDRTQTDTNCVKNGFVNGVLEAYGKHHHLILRPEDVWFAVLTQLNWYINGHAEELRNYFVQHKAQEALSVVASLRGFGGWAKDITREFEKRIKDPTLKDWLMPNFSTTKPADLVVASALMIGSMQKYFKCYAGVLCGLPSATLLGEKKDWEEILHRLERLPEFGREPTKWYTLLLPVLRHMVATFETPDSPQIKHFWSQICHVDKRCGTNNVTGWITAFCLWDSDGKLQRGAYHSMQKGEESVEFIRVQMSENLAINWKAYHPVPLEDIPAAVASVALTVIDLQKNTKRPAIILAGLMGYQYCNFAQKSKGWLISPNPTKEPEVTQAPAEEQESPVAEPPVVRQGPSWAPEILPKEDLKPATRGKGNKMGSGKRWHVLLRRIFCGGRADQEDNEPADPTPLNPPEKPVSDHSYAESEDYVLIEKRVQPVKTAPPALIDEAPGLNAIQPESGWWAFHLKPTHENARWTRDDEKAYEMLTGRPKPGEPISFEADESLLQNESSLDSPLDSPTHERALSPEIDFSPPREHGRSPEPYNDADNDSSDEGPVRIDLQMDKLGSRRRRSGKRSQSPFFGGSVRAR